MCAPIVWDDWAYKEQEGWSAVLPNAYHEYFTWNPRVASTLLTRCFSLMPPLLVDILNTAAFLLLAALSLYLAFGKAWKYWATHWQGVALFWVLTVGIVPVFGEVFLWHCGAASYLWVHLCAMGMLALLRPLWEEDALQDSSTSVVELPLLWMPLLGLMALVAGCSNFHTGPAILLSCAVLTWLGRNRIRPLWGMYLLLVLCAISSILMIIAPGNDVRLSHKELHVVSRMDMLFSLLKPHLRIRTTILYLLLIAAFWWRKKRDLWNREDSHTTILILGIALLTQIVFMASPVPPPSRGWQITFTFIIVAALRILLPVLTVYRPRISFRLGLILLAILPMRGLPKMYAEREWIYRAMALMEEHRDSHQDVELPYWPFQTDKLFGFIGGFVSSDDPQHWTNTSVARCYGLRSVWQSNLRCTYSGILNGWQAEAVSYDAPRYVTLTRWTLTPEADLRQTGNVFLCIAHPDERKKYWKPTALLHRLFASDEDNSITLHELESRGYRVEVLPLPISGQNEHLQIDWKRGKKFSKKPESPILWAAILPSPPQQNTPFSRLVPDRKGL